jgi:hypothetical protein
MRRVYILSGLLLIFTISSAQTNVSRITGEINGYDASFFSGDDGFLRLSAGGGTNLSAKSFIDLSGYSTVPDMVQNITLGTSGMERMRITNSGNVGIGTSDTKGYKLAVAGNMVAESIQVKLRGAWPDYVFAREYKLPSLEETARHIKEKGHLPGIPLASEVKANGIDVGEMNAKLLQKIEELTLYLIEMEKQNKNQQESIQLLKISNEKLIAEMALIKSKF